MVACVLACALALMAGRSDAPAAAQDQSPAVSAETGAVLVEAFVVEAQLPALAELGVSPIGQEPNAVSVADILRCLDSGGAKVIGGVKAASRPEQNAEVRATGTTYIGRGVGSPRVNYQAYESGTEFAVSAQPISHIVPAVCVQYGLIQSVFVEKGRASDAPPDLATWDWSGSMVLTPGVPQIAAATQDGETAVFLLLTAHVAGK